MGNRPGVMLYFEIRNSLTHLTQAEKGDLLDAILQYGEEGTAPELTGAPGLAWAFVRPWLDRDRRRYQEKCRQNSELSRRRWGGERPAPEQKKQGEQGWMRQYVRPEKKPPAPEEPKPDSAWVRRQVQQINAQIRGASRAPDANCNDN